MAEDRPQEEEKPIAEPTQLIYANILKAEGGPYDVALEFGYKAGEAEPVFPVRVAMSWEHAKSLLQLLDNLIEGFEERVAEVPDVSKLENEIEKAEQ